MFLTSIWSYFPWFFYLLLAESLRESRGRFNLIYLILLTVFLGIFVYWSYVFYFPKRLEVEAQQLRINWEKSEEWVKVLWFLFSLALFIKHGMFYAHNSIWILVIKILLGINFITSLLSLGKFFKYPWPFKAFMSVGLLSLGVSLILIPLASPSPHIDVWYFATIASDLLLQGKNPYLHAYPDVYSGNFEAKFDLIYWPISTYFYALGRAFFGEVRVFLIAAQFIVALGLKKLTEGTKPLFSLGIILLWISYPITFFSLEQAWVEALTFPFLVGFAWCLKQQRWNFAGIMLGNILMTKQYMIFLCVLSFCYVYSLAGKKQAIKYFFITAATSFVIVAPFLWWDKTIFFEKTVLGLLRTPPQEYSLSWIAYFLKFHQIALSGKMVSLVYVLVTFLGCFLVYKNAYKGQSFLWAINIILYFVVFFLGKQAYCNYYHVLALMMLLFLVLLREELQQNVVKKFIPTKKET